MHPIYSLKKFLPFILLSLISFTTTGQRIAVLEFSAGVGVSLGDVDGLSSIFTTYFHPYNYTLVERSEIDRVIDEQQLQRSSITESQMINIGKILNLSKLVVGKINIIAGEYNVDVRVINVETGVIVATDGASFPHGSYRNNMKNLAESLSSRLSSSSDIGQVAATPPSSLPQSLVKKFKKYPEVFDIAVYYDNNIYFISEDTLPELLSFPDNDGELYHISSVMIKGGEDAYGVGVVNGLDLCPPKIAVPMINLLPDTKSGAIILQNIDRINNIIKKAGGQPMESKYWMNIPGPDFLGVLNVPEKTFEKPTSQNAFFVHHKHLCRLIWSFSEMKKMAKR